MGMENEYDVAERVKKQLDRDREKFDEGYRVGYREGYNKAKDERKLRKEEKGDLISREALRNSLLDSRPDNIEQSDINFDTCDIKIWLSSVLKTIDNAPTVGPRIEYGTDGQPYKLSISNGEEFERPQGEWKGRRYYRPSTNQYDCEMSICSECGEEYSYDAETGISITDYSFCPKCGALMKKGGAERVTLKLLKE